MGTTLSGAECFVPYETSMTAKPSSQICKQIGQKSCAKFLLKRARFKKILREKISKLFRGLGLEWGRHNGLGRHHHPGHVCLSSTVCQMRGNRVTREQSVRIWRSLSVRKRADMLHQFTMMASGSRGPWVPGSNSRLRVRDHYYGDWSNDDFKWVVSQIEELQGL